jgi:FKBP-type peptidyl-prolyl cis-trans isomerase
MRKNNNKTILFLITGFMILFASCNPSDKYVKEEKRQIQDYLSSNSGLNFVLKPSGLYYLEVVTGAGLSPVRTDSAYVRYTGKLLDGTVFDSNVSSGKLYGFILGQNIIGFDEGVSLMKTGGKSTLLIPSSIGYGSAGNPYAGISGYTPLLFDVELVKVVPFVGK